MKEIWKDIKGYEGLYLVSNFGRIKSLKRKARTYYGERTVSERIMKQSLHFCGYLTVVLHNLIAKSHYIHKLVAIAFLNHIPCNQKLVVDHIDFNRTNNHLSNLRVVTTRKNTDQKHLKSSSKYTGVHWKGERKKWVATISINSKTKYLGSFPCEIDASNAYELALNNQ